MSFPYSPEARSPRGPPPERQRGYKYYASQSSHSHSYSGSQGDVGEGGGAVKPEEDDGGWGADYNTVRAKERQAARMARHGAVPTNNYHSNFGVMHGAPSPVNPQTRAPSQMSSVKEAIMANTSTFVEAPSEPVKNDLEHQEDRDEYNIAAGGTAMHATEVREADDGEEDGGWTVDDPTAQTSVTQAPTLTSPHQKRSVPSAAMAIRRCLGPDVYPPPPAAQTVVMAPEQLPPQGHGREYNGPEAVDVPAYVRKANRRTPNRESIPNPRPWGSSSIADVRSTSPQESPAPQQADPSKATDDDTRRPAASLNHPDLSAVTPTFQVINLQPKPPMYETGAPLERSDSADLSDGGWTKESELKRWARGVEPGAAPERIHTPHQEDEGKLTAAADDIPHRPSSVPPLPPPVVAYVSDDDDSEPDTALPTPTSGVFRAASRHSLANPEVKEPEPAVEEGDQRTERNDNARDSASFRLSAVSLGDKQAYAESDVTETRRDRDKAYRSGRQQLKHLSSRVYWKRDPHPAFSASFAKCRINVELPYQMRIENLKTMLQDHMSRFGTIRCVWIVDAMGEVADKAMVIYDTEESVSAFMASPDRDQCFSRAPNRAGATAIDIKTSIAPENVTSKTVFIKITGQRADSRSRSASPELQREGGVRGNQVEWNMRPLPHGIFVDAIPHYNKRHGKVEYYAHIRPISFGYEGINRRALRETGQAARELSYIEMGRRVPEKDIVPQLVEYFAEIIDIVPPTSSDQGWLVSVGGVRDARALITELSKVSGISARWATADDGVDREEDGALTDTDENSPMTKYEQLAGGHVERNEQLRGHRTRKPRDNGVKAKSRNEVKPQEAEAQAEIKGIQGQALQVQMISDASEVLPQSPAVHTPETVVAAAEINQPVPVELATDSAIPVPIAINSNNLAPENLPEDHTPQFDYPAHLQRRLEYTYRGRILRMDNTGPEPRFYDDAGVFVGRLCQDMETTETLFDRFSRYGHICDVEYRKSPGATYGSARILFADVSSAERALGFETGKTNYGSLLKIDRRRVLPSDVVMKEFLVDEFGRAFSPSMAAQYSPPRPALRQPEPAEPEFERPSSVRRAPPAPIAIPHLSLPPRTHEGAQAGPFPVTQPYGWHSLEVPVPTPGQVVPYQAIWSPVSPQPTARAMSGNAPNDGFGKILLSMGVSYCPPMAAPAPLSASPIAPRHDLVPQPYAPGPHPVSPGFSGFVAPCILDGGMPPVSPVVPTQSGPAPPSTTYGIVYEQPPPVTATASAPYSSSPTASEFETPRPHLANGNHLSPAIHGKGQPSSLVTMIPPPAAPDGLQPTDNVQYPRLPTSEPPTGHATPAISPELSKSTRSSNGPRIKEFRVDESGKLNVVYDTDDLRRYCEEVGIPGPKEKGLGGPEAVDRSPSSTTVVAASGACAEDDTSSTLGAQADPPMSAASASLDRDAIVSCSTGLPPSDPNGELPGLNHVSLGHRPTRSQSIPIPWVDQIPVDPSHERGPNRWSTPPSMTGHPGFLSSVNSVVAHGRQWGAPPGPWQPQTGEMWGTPWTGSHAGGSPHDQGGRRASGELVDSKSPANEGPGQAASVQVSVGDDGWPQQV